MTVIAMSDRGSYSYGNEELRVRKIREGTVIDHITAGSALTVLRILGLSGKEGNIISIVMNVPSKKLGKKDIVKIEGRELNSKEVAMIALIAPRATINIIRNYKVVKKERVRLPSEIKNIIKCINPNCITNSEHEPVQPIFKVLSDNPLRLRCQYCSIILTQEDVERQLT